MLEEETYGLLISHATSPLDGLSPFGLVNNYSNLHVLIRDEWNSTTNALP